MKTSLETTTNYWTSKCDLLKKENENLKEEVAKLKGGGGEYSQYRSYADEIYEYLKIHEDFEDISGVGAGGDNVGGGGRGPETLRLICEKLVDKIDEIKEEYELREEIDAENYREEYQGVQKYEDK